MLRRAASIVDDRDAVVGSEADKRQDGIEVCDMHGRSRQVPILEEGLVEEGYSVVAKVQAASMDGVDEVWAHLYGL